jgi:hypothetical protein
MQLSRLGALHQCRLSFVRQLIRRMARDRWRIGKSALAIGPDGRGHAVYTVDTGQRRYALVAFARPDRADCTAPGAGWDATFALCDSTPDAGDLARLASSLTSPDLGRVTDRELCVARAVPLPPLWDHAVVRLAHGHQPDSAQLAAAGALMQVTFLAASGKIGTADRELIADRPELQAPFQAEMLTLYLIRLFARDLLHAQAAKMGKAKAAELATPTARDLGIILVPGPELAQFPLAHPCLFNNWIMAREEAIARVRALRQLRPEDWVLVAELATRISARPGAKGDLARIGALMAPGPQGAQPWSTLLERAEAEVDVEAQEAVASTMLEPYARLVDGLGHCMADGLDQGFRIDGALPLGRLRRLIEEVFGAPQPVKHARESTGARSWAIAQDARLAHRAMRPWPDETPCAIFLLHHPEHRRAVRRAQITGFAPYAEIRGAPADGVDTRHGLLRATLSFLGATDIVPGGDHGLQARLCAGAPLPDALVPGSADRWVYPEAAP